MLKQENKWFMDWCDLERDESSKGDQRELGTRVSKGDKAKVHDVLENPREHEAKTRMVIREFMMETEGEYPIISNVKG
eukprot:14254464-Ditylum_brightwellii.AAC.1